MIHNSVWLRGGDFVKYGIASTGSPFEEMPTVFSKKIVYFPVEHKYAPNSYIIYGVTDIFIFRSIACMQHVSFY